ncbi:hypothetical protein ABZ468_42035 [Streptomyces sp. NPDC005708]|uniref:hypothetical protein n=1 Tax=unclassified Streptomyces TaxID=2593676 RepID=UPI0033ECE3AA
MGRKGRVFVRGLTSETYGLGEYRRRQLAVQRVRDDSEVVDDAKVAPAATATAPANSPWNSSLRAGSRWRS